MIFAKVSLRIKAFLLDYLIIAAYIIFLAIVSVGLGFGPLRSVTRAMFANPNYSEFSAFLLLVAPVILYFTLLESSAWQATWGKRKMGLCVVDTHGARLNFPRSLVRSLLKFVPWELTHACLWRIPGWPLAPSMPSPIIVTGLVMVWVLVAVYLASLLVSKKHQAIYDWIAETYVIVGSERGKSKVGRGEIVSNGEEMPLRLHCTASRAVQGGTGRFIVIPKDIGTMKGGSSQVCLRHSAGNDI